jgi:transposase-like protein
MSSDVKRDMIRCPYCKSEDVFKNNETKTNVRYKCNNKKCEKYKKYFSVLKSRIGK